MNKVSISVKTPIRKSKRIAKLLQKLHSLPTDPDAPRLGPLRNQQKNKKFISGSQLRNYILDDPFVDILNLKYPQKKVPRFTHFLFSQGNKFESLINQLLISHFGKENCVTVYDPNTYTEKLASYTKEYHSLFKETMKHIHNGVPVIFQPVLLDSVRGLSGIPDILVQKKFISKSSLFSLISGLETIPDSTYLIVDIKWSTLHFKKNLELKSSLKFKSYAVQMNFYKDILDNLFIPVADSCIVIGRKADFAKDPGAERLDSLEKLATPSGVVDPCREPALGSKYRYQPIAGLIKITDDIKKETNLAVNWVSSLNEYGQTWDIETILSGKESTFPYEFVDPFPNAKNNDSCHYMKNEFMQKSGELTQFYYLSRNHAKNLHKQGIYSIQDLKEEHLPFKGTQTGDLMRTILSKHKAPDSTCFSENKLPASNYVENGRTPKERCLKNSLPFDPKEAVYIDFEVISNIYQRLETLDDLIVTPEKYPTLIGIIGCYYFNSSETAPEFKSFVLKDLTKISEKQLVQDFLNFLDSNFKPGTFLVHYSNAEPRFLSDYILNFCSYEFFDLCDFLKRNRIILGYNFKLKEVSGSGSQLDPMEGNLDLVRFIRGEIPYEKIKNYISYNRNDCEAMYRIVT